jgi:phosphonate transport system substrate-binding protein
MASNHTNCGTVGPFSYLLGVQEAGAEAIAVETDAPNADNPVYDPAALPSYYSTIVVKKGSGIQHVADLKGHSFSFVDPASTSGHLMPANGMIQNGLDPDKDIEAIYAGSHPTSGLAVWSDKVDAGAIFEAALVQLQAEGQINLCFWQDGKTNVQRTQADFDALYASCPDGYMVPIWYSDPIPNTPFAVAKTIPESLKQAIYDALMNTKNDPELIAALGYWYTDPTDTGNTGAFDPVRVDALYDPLREVAKNLDLDLKSFGS